MAARRRTGHRITLSGFDIQNSRIDNTTLAMDLVAEAKRVDPELAAAIERHEPLVRPPISDALRDTMLRDYGRLASALDAASAQPSRARMLALQQTRSRLKLIRMLTASMGEGTAIRDEGMADNLDFILDRLYPGRKVIVWAHNGHISRFRHQGRPKMMGEWVHERRGAEVYTVALEMGRGVATENNRSRYIVAPPGEGSLEALLASAGRRMSFIDVSKASAGDWADTIQTVRAWGRWPMQIVPRASYDGIIYIDTVTPPDYM